MWNGETITNIMPEDQLGTAVRFYINWSHDGRLAFMIMHGWSDDAIPEEIYVWDGHTTTNLSQNPDGQDGAIIWSQDGQLMFRSRRNDKIDLYVWDGVSLKDGQPDSSAFISVAPEMKPYNATWLNHDIIGFTVYKGDVSSGTKDIVLWDLNKQAVIERFPVSSDDTDSRLAEGGRVILSSRLASGIPSVYLDVENTRGEILFSTHTGEYAWSASGYLAYCGIDGSISSLISIWDGQDTWVVDQATYRSVQWQSGQNTFSCNNG